MKTLILAAVLLAGCAHTLYWSKPGVGVQETAAELSACRLAANAGGQKVFSARQLEEPCMVAKGFVLGRKPPG